MCAMKAITWLKYLAGVALSVVLVVLLVVVFMDWNLMRAPIGRWVSGATGRDFVIRGDLTVNLGLRPRIVANDLVLGNAAWSDKPNMLEIKRVDLRLDLFRLLTTGLAFPEIALSAPQVVLEVSRDGLPNWIFNEQKANQAPAFPVIDRLTIDHGSVTYRAPRLNTDLLFELKTTEGDPNNPAQTLEIVGKGHFKGLPTSLHAQGGGAAQPAQCRNPLPDQGKWFFG